MLAIKKEVTVNIGGRIEIQAPELEPGSKAEVIIMIHEKMGKGSTLGSIIGRGKGCFATPAEVDTFLRNERDSWD